MDFLILHAAGNDDVGAGSADVRNNQLAHFDGERDENMISLVDDFMVLSLGGLFRIPADDIFRNTLACFAVQESLSSGCEIPLDGCF